MKISNIFLVLCFLWVGISSCTLPKSEKVEETAAPKPLADPVKPSQLVRIVKAKADQIDQEFGNYEKTEIIFEVEGIEEKMIGWTKGGELIKLTDEILDDHGPMTIHYYYENGQCIYILDRSELYERGTIHVTEDRYFLDEKTMLGHWNKRKSVREGASTDLTAIPNEEREFDLLKGEYQAGLAVKAKARFLEAAK
ncbi:MAG TPA: hypothetical protein ENJ82_04350 [Bacteroidetes bacterium]|nr:hypothetical protein [Bacteroidota bacterium]